MFNLLGKLGAVAFVILMLLLVILGPWITIWAANTLFPVLAIEYTFRTWLSVIILGAFLRANVSVKRKD
jgi:hypothetical protein